MADRASGVRIAMICDHKDCLPPHRAFFDTEEEAAQWECPTHHRAVRQENRPYLKGALEEALGIPARSAGTDRQEVVSSAGPASPRASGLGKGSFGARPKGG